MAALGKPCGSNQIILHAQNKKFAPCISMGKLQQKWKRRQFRNLLRSADLLQHAAISAQQGDELVAEDLRAAAHQLGRLLGRVDVEDVLDSIFRDFCIGK